MERAETRHDWYEMIPTPQSKINTLKRMCLNKRYNRARLEMFLCELADIAEMTGYEYNFLEDVYLDMVAQPDMYGLEESDDILLKAWWEVAEISMERDW